MTAPARATVLVVDDDLDVQSLLALSLRTLGGFDVVAVAGTLAEGESALAAHAPDVAVVDIGLPDGLGSALLQSASAGRTRFVILSAQVAHQHADLLQAGACAVLDKPCPPQSVIDAVFEALRAEQ